MSSRATLPFESPPCMIASPQSVHFQFWFIMLLFSTSKDFHINLKINVSLQLMCTVIDRTFAAFRYKHSAVCHVSSSILCIQSVSQSMLYSATSPWHTDRQRHKTDQHFKQVSIPSVCIFVISALWHDIPCWSFHCITPVENAKMTYKNISHFSSDMLRYLGTDTKQIHLLWKTNTKSHTDHICLSNSARYVYRWLSKLQGLFRLINTFLNPLDRK